MKRRLLSLYAALVYLFLYAPIIVLVLFSFNRSKLNATWTGFTVDWYVKLLHDKPILQATGNTLVVALVSTAASTVIGTAAALAMHRFNFFGKRLMEAVLYIPIVIPEIVMGVSLLALYVMLGFELGLPTVIIAHIAFSISFVTVTVRARLHGFNRYLEEAAMDLGADEWTTFRRVTFPLILPGIMSGALLALTLSLDDFVITFFTAGPGSTTLPLRIYSMLKLAVTPEVNALSTALLGTTLLLVTLSQRLQRKDL